MGLGEASSAVDGEQCAGDVGLACEGEHGVGDVVRGAGALKGGSGEIGLLEGGRGVVGPICDADADSVGTDRGGELPCQTECEAGEGGFAGTVGGEVLPWAFDADIEQVDDGTLGGFERGAEVEGELVSGASVDAGVGFEELSGVDGVGIGGWGGGRAGGDGGIGQVDGGVVDEEPEPAVGDADDIDRVRWGGGGWAMVCLVDGGWWEVGEAVGEVIGLSTAGAAVEDDADAVLGEVGGDGGSDASGGTGDEGPGLHRGALWGQRGCGVRVERSWFGGHA